MEDLSKVTQMQNELSSLKEIADSPQVDPAVVQKQVLKTETVDQQKTGLAQLQA